MPLNVSHCIGIPCCQIFVERGVHTFTGHPYHKGSSQIPSQWFFRPKAMKFLEILEFSGSLDLFSSSPYLLPMVQIVWYILWKKILECTYNSFWQKVQLFTDNQKNDDKNHKPWYHEDCNVCTPTETKTRQVRTRLLQLKQKQIRLEPDYSNWNKNKYDQNQITPTDTKQIRLEPGLPKE